MLDKKLVRETGQVRLILTATIGLGLLSGFFTVLQASWFARIINAVFIGGQDLSGVWPGLLLLLPLFFLRSAVLWLRDFFAQRMVSRIQSDLRRRLLDKLFHLGPLYARQERTGELVNLFGEGVDALEAYFARYIPQLALAAMIPPLIVAFVFPLDLVSGLIMVLTAPLIPLFMILIGKWADELSREQWQSLSRMSAHFLDALQGLTTLKIFGRSKTQIEIIGRISDRFRETTMGVLRVAFLSALVLELLATLGTALVAVALGLALVYGRITFEKAFFILLLAPEFYLPLRLLGTQFHAGLSGASAAERIYQVLDTVLEDTTAGGAFLESPRGRLTISFAGVSCRYEKERGAVLQDVSFELLPGQKTILAGASGAGKTTVTNLLLRFLEPSSGEIMVNGIPLHKIEAGEWRQRTALVSQHPYLFPGTIGENIRLGRPQATEDELMTAARLADADDFIRQLPAGYDTLIGDGGAALSGGQQQRVALARAFLKDARLLIIDEGTSGLDQDSEGRIQSALELLAADRTVLVIAHHLPLADHSGQILVLEDGCLVESGDHPSLMKKMGAYHRLVTAGGAG